MLARGMNARGPNDVLGLVGSTVDQVRFDACVDAGGFGLIYRGFHLALGEHVAIKCLRIAAVSRADDAIREQIAGRFRDETKILYRLSQGNLDIVRCLGGGAVVAPVTREMTPYMVLEWLDGCTLSAELKERKAQNLGARTLEQTVSLLDGAVNGIAYAHQHDVVHRDIKPGNLFITRTREGVRVKVLDFGLAKILSDESIGIRPSVETAAGVHFCSPSYGAPEQFTSKAGKIGPWTDVYSLALVLLECMKGEKIRPASTLAEGLFKAIDPVTGSPSPSSLGLSLPPAAEELFVRAVAQNPQDRPHDVGVFWSALKEAMTSRAPAAPRRDVGATIADASMNDAMRDVRAAVARASQRPPPFAGTMLMHNAPTGAPHLPPSAPPPPPPTAPDVATAQPTTAPLAQPLTPGIASPPAAPPARKPPHKMDLTMPLGATSPLAASLGGATASPVQNLPLAPTTAAMPAHPGLAQAPSPSAPPPGAAPPQFPGDFRSTGPQLPSDFRTTGPRAAPGDDPRRTDPRANLGSIPPAGVPTSNGIAVMIAVVAIVLVAVAGVALYLLRVRGH